ncbi:MAG TPA: DNA-binding domain-containing protein [Burkholderiales bacterium]|nr:putative DNA-binding domain-containing protein [Betaproteobacteria bacterium]HQR52072.1 DNA-binding domain-containing protein [Burkholderiales bacterium]
MRALRTLQLAFSNAVLSAGDRGPDAIAEPAGGERGSRFAIYRDGYRLRLAESLATDYPATRAVLGAERFAALAQAFVAAHPSRHFNLRWYGREFADFLRANREAQSNHIADLAAFEWAVAGAFDAADAPPLTVDDVAAVPPESWPYLVLAFHPSCRRLQVGKHVPSLWQAATAGDTVSCPADDPTDAPWILWRRELAVFYRQLAADEADALDGAAQGANFAGICVRLSAHVPEAQTPARAAALLRQWVEDGLVVGFDDGTGDLVSGGGSSPETAARDPSAPV